MQSFSMRLAPDQAGRYLTVQVRGVVKALDLRAVYDEIVSLYPGRHRLWDYQGADLTELTPADLVGLANHAARREPAQPGIRVAILVARDVEYGISRMFETLAESRYSASISVFRSREEALEWVEAAPVETTSFTSVQQVS